MTIFLISHDILDPVKFNFAQSIASAYILYKIFALFYIWKVSNTILIQNFFN